MFRKRGPEAAFGHLLIPTAPCRLHSARVMEPNVTALRVTREINLIARQFECAPAEIRMGREPIPAGEAGAMDARAVIADIRPHVKYPEG